MATCNDIPSKLNGLKKAEITQTPLKDCKCCLLFYCRSKCRVLCLGWDNPMQQHRLGGQLARKQFCSCWRYSQTSYTWVCSVPLQQRQAVVSQAMLASVTSRSFPSVWHLWDIRRTMGDLVFLSKRNTLTCWVESSRELPRWSWGWSTSEVVQGEAERIGLVQH